MNFHLTNQAWQTAEQYLAGKPCGTKYEKVERDPKTGIKDPTNKRTSHSFMIIKGVVYAIGDYIDEGGSSIVKFGLTKEGTLVAIKIDDKPLEMEDSDAFKAATKIGLLIGQGLRKAANMIIKFRKSDRKIITNSKRYTVMQWRGESLMAQIEEEDKLTNTQKWMLCLRICLLIETLHEQGIVHADLKAENLTAHINGNDIKVNIVDLGFAKLLKDGKKDIVADKASGSAGFVSPEIIEQKRYSSQSDCFALAVMLLYQIDITCLSVPYDYYNQYYDSVIKNLSISFIPLKWLITNFPNLVIEEPLKHALAGMLETDYHKRTDQSNIVLYLCDKLENDPNLEEALKIEVQEIRAQILLKQLKNTEASESLTEVDTALPTTSKPLIVSSKRKVSEQEFESNHSSVSKQPRMM